MESDELRSVFCVPCSYVSSTQPSPRIPLTNMRGEVLKYLPSVQLKPVFPLGLNGLLIALTTVVIANPVTRQVLHKLGKLLRLTQMKTRTLHIQCSSD